MDALQFFNTALRMRLEQIHCYNSDNQETDISECRKLESVIDQEILRVHKILIKMNVPQSESKDFFDAVCKMRMAQKQHLISRNDDEKQTRVKYYEQLVDNAIYNVKSKFIKDPDKLSLIEKTLGPIKEINKTK